MAARGARAAARPHAAHRRAHAARRRRSPKPRISVFTQALADLGWSDGRDVLDLRWYGDDANRMRALAQELVGLQLDVIVTMGSTPATAALQQETRTTAGRLFRAAANMIGARCAVMNTSGMTTRPRPGLRPRAMISASL
jgi:hypothetical protein